MYQVFYSIYCSEACVNVNDGVAFVHQPEIDCIAEPRQSGSPMVDDNKPL